MCALTYANKDNYVFPTITQGMLRIIFLKIQLWRVILFSSIKRIVLQCRNHYSTQGYMCMKDILQDILNKWQLHTQLLFTYKYNTQIIWWFLSIGYGNICFADQRCAYYMYLHYDFWLIYAKNTIELRDVLHDIAHSHV